MFALRTPAGIQSRLRWTGFLSRTSLSTLLDVLDGIGSSEGRAPTMTTNHIERPDPALIRPERADMKVEFQLADKGIQSNSG